MGGLYIYISFSLAVVSSPHPHDFSLHPIQFLFPFFWFFLFVQLSSHSTAYFTDFMAFLCSKKNKFFEKETFLRGMLGVLKM